MLRDLPLLAGIFLRRFVLYPLRRLTWPVELLAAKLACSALDRHRNGSDAWERLCDSKVPAFRDRPIFMCRHCGVVAFHDNEPRHLVQLATGHFTARRTELHRRLQVAALAVFIFLLAIALTTGGAP